MFTVLYCDLVTEAKWIQLETIILSDITETQMDMHVCIHMLIITIKYRRSTLHFIHPKKLKEKEGSKEHG